MKGAYILLARVEKDSRIKAGALGKTEFPKGKYVYIGSAMNSLEKRIGRHFSRKKKKHWHIDYFLANKNAKIKKTFYRESGKKEECRIAQKIAGYGNAVKGFGCSDCNCKSHLFRVEKFFPPNGFMEWKK